jgi:hypothetical protein
MKKINFEQMAEAVAVEMRGDYIHTPAIEEELKKEWREGKSEYELPALESKTRNPILFDFAEYVEEVPGAYLTRDKETGIIIDEFGTLEEAIEAVHEYNEKDAEEDNYTPDFYEVYDTNAQKVVYTAL